MSDVTGQSDYLREPQPLHGRVLLAPPDPAWPVRYAEVAARIRAALGPAALDVQHVGSTSVAGLSAKPVLDVLLLVVDPADEPAYVPPLETAGFDLALREPAWQEHRLLRGVDPAVNLHVFAPDSPEGLRMLTFRDLLRARPADRDRYEHVKRELSQHEWEYVQDYADAKSSVVEEILSRAAPQAAD
jgi:GrpB-like predicted nucleotidyltransferase (UPF0157 family)